MAFGNSEKKSSKTQTNGRTSQSNCLMRCFVHNGEFDAHLSLTHTPKRSLLAKFYVNLQVRFSLGLFC